MNEKKRSFSVYVKILLAELMLLECIYLAGAVFFASHFLPNSYVNGIDVSFMNADQARAAVKDAYDRYRIELKEQNDVSEYIRGEEINLKYDFFYNTKDVMNRQSLFLWVIQSFQIKDYDSELSISYDSEKLADCVHNLNCVKRQIENNGSRTAIIKTDSGYRLERDASEYYVDAEMLEEKLAGYIRRMAPSLNLIDENCYGNKEEVSAEQIRILENQLNQIGKLNITYHIGEDELVLTGDQIMDWIQLTDDYDISLNRAMIREYLEGIRNTYYESGEYVLFHTNSGDMVRLPDYVNPDVPLLFDEEIICELILGMDRESETVYEWSCIDEDTEISVNMEIDLSGQMLYVYQNGVQVMNTQIQTKEVSEMGICTHGVFVSKNYRLQYFRMMNTEQTLEAGYIYVPQENMEQIDDYMSNVTKIYIYSDEDLTDEDSPDDETAEQQEYNINLQLPVDSQVEAPVQNPPEQAPSESPSSEEGPATEEMRSVDVTEEPTIEPTEPSDQTIEEGPESEQITEPVVI